MKLFERGVLLVVFPLLCQVMFVVALIALMVRIEAEMVTESHSRDLISSIFKLSRQAMDSVYTLNLESQLNSTNVSDRASDEALVSFRKNLDEVVQLASQDRQQEKDARILAAHAAVIMGKFQEVRDLYHNGQPDRKRINESNRALLRSGSLFTNVVAHMISKEEAALAQGPARSRMLRSVARLTFLGALIASIFTAVWLGLMYARAIRQPLSIIEVNTRRLSEHQELLPISEGVDEISQLDRLLHDVADAVELNLARERDAIENAADLICSLDRQGMFSRVNQFSQTLLGIAAGDLCGSFLLDLVVPEQCAFAEKQLADCRSAEQMQVFELQLLSPTAGVIDTRWSVLWSESDASLFCVVHDITMEKAIETVKEDFLNMITHDLRSPLTSMRGSMTVILEGLRGDISQAVREEVTGSARNIELLIGFVDDLLDFQKLKDGKVALAVDEVDVRSVIDDAIKMVERLAASKEITIVCPDESLAIDLIQADHRKLVQVVTNLLTNAVKFSPSNSAIRIDVTSTADEYRLSVSDNGPGVPLMFREKIFLPFEQLPSERAKEGSGLGLAICKLIAEAHGGSMGVGENQPEGSIFWISLPQN
ncbi:MAG: PAS domain-containing protein [Cyanobacteria bacterium]|nr:PAS domain-containing protein [Cyanobacteriota bacterium]